MLVRAAKVPTLRAGTETPPHLNQDEVNRLTETYQRWADENPSPQRARHWAVFLMLRFTGARVSEVLVLDDTRDLDFRRSEVVIPTLKRRRPSRRTVPLPPNVVAEFGRILAAFPELRGRLFRLDRSTVYRVFRKRCRAAGIPGALAHPHVLRHTRAIELIRAGVPVSAVQQLLGHADISTTERPLFRGKKPSSRAPGSGHYNKMQVLLHIFPPAPLCETQGRGLDGLIDRFTLDQKFRFLIYKGKILTKNMAEV